MAEYLDTLMWKELNQWVECGADTAENHQVAADIATEAKKRNIVGVYTLARGTSDHAMIFLKYLFESYLGIPVSSGAPSAVTIYHSQMKLNNFLVIGCSQSGKAEDVREVLSQAKQNGALTLAITNDVNSPLAKEAKYHLYCGVGEEKSVAATKTFSAQLYLGYLLAKAFGGNILPDLGDFKQKLAEAAKIADKETDSFSDWTKPAKDCFILARGISACLAYECGLKLQETCYIKSRAYYSSDFYHGPMAMIEKGSKVILLAPKGGIDETSSKALAADSLKCAKKMEELGADLYIVTDNTENFADVKAHFVDLKAGANEIEEDFYLALTIQMLACKTSCKRGLNPDVPRALKKVTVTI